MSGWPNAAPLRGRTALITGATRGIGRAAAETLAAMGADVAVCGVRDADAVAAAISSAHGVRTLALAGDLGDAAVAPAHLQAVWKAWKQLDVLVNNAGVLDAAVVGMITAEHIDRTLAVNTRAAVLLAQGAARLMMRARRGSIVNVSSIVGVRGAVGQVVYAASKAAVNGLTVAMAKELAPHNVRVNAVAPGFIDTDLVTTLTPEQRAERVARIGLGRFGTADEVAAVIGFLASDLAAYVTGQVIGIDGGLIA